MINDYLEGQYGLVWGQFSKMMSDEGIPSQLLSSLFDRCANRGHAIQLPLIP